MEISHIVEGVAPKERERLIEGLVCELTGISAEDYAQQKFEKGIEFLERYQFSEANVAELSRQELYWAWWRNRWTMRELTVLKEYDEVSIRRYGRRLLESVHERCLSKMRIAGIIKIRN